MNPVDLLPYMQAMGMPSQEEMLARRIRSQQNMKQTNEQAHGMDLLEFAAQGSNNPALAKAMSGLAQTQRSRYKPQGMGAAGYAIPATGEFVESPMYAEEKQAGRVSQLQNALNAIQARKDAAAAAEASKAERAAAERASREAIAAGRNDVALAIAGMRQEAKAGEDRRKGEDRRSKDIDNSLRRFTTDLEKGGIPELAQALELAEGTLSKYKEGELPGFGRLVSLVPDGVATEEMQLTRQALQSAANIVLKSRSGAAVTNAEMLRFLRELGSGKGMTEAVIRKGFKNLREFTNKRIGNLTGGASDDVLERYYENTGTDYRRKKANPVPAGAADEIGDGWGQPRVKGQ